jgi:uncharacterized DUF497 family protein
LGKSIALFGFIRLKSLFLWGLDSVVFLIYNGIMDIDLGKLEGFEWDEGNQSKSLEKHGITPLETEEAFFHFYLVFPDPRHSKAEPRFGMYGQTNSGKLLFIAFTIRNRQVRIISARPANKKERNSYEEALKKAA